ncbi:unnamed protein product [Diamesa serratosioi]
MNIFLGIKHPGSKKYEKKIVENVDLNSLVETLKNSITKNEINTDEIQFIYCGDVMDDKSPLFKYNLSSGSTIHIFRKKKEIPLSPVYTQITEFDIQRIISLYRQLNTASFHKIARPEVIKIILDEHKQLENDLMAMSILKDPLLLANLQNPETVRRIAEQHRELIEASETIVKTLKQAKSLTDPEVSIPAAVATVDENLSDSSSSGSDSNSPEASVAQGISQRITSEQVASALFHAQGQGSNSLANISQRNFSSNTDHVELQNEELNVDPEQSSSSSSTNNQRNSASMLMSTMSEVVRAARIARSSFIPNYETQESSSGEVPFANNEHAANQSEELNVDEEDGQMIRGYQVQLQQMQEMGLINTSANIQALVICSGDVGSAINLVLSDLNNIT